MKKLLVTGAAGFLGWQACQSPALGWEMVGGYHQREPGLPRSVSVVPCDLTQPDEVWGMLKSVRPEAVFHLAACASPHFCELHPEESHQVNVGAVGSLAEMCADRRIRLVFCSSEQVFDGTEAPYAEADPPSPKNVYGQQKWAAEQLVSACHPEASIARIAVLFGGQGGPSANNFLSQWLTAWDAGLDVNAFHDEIRSFLSARSAVEGLFCLLEQGAEGIFHLGGGLALSRFDFAEMVRAVFGKTKGRTVRLSQSDIETAAYRPPNLTLDTGNIESIGFRPSHPLDELSACLEFGA